MKKILLWSIVLNILFISGLNGEVWEVGGPALMMDSYGAREIALGDTFTGIANDINTITVNPAGLATLDSLEGNVMFMSYPMGMSFFHLAGGMPLAPGYVATSLTFFSLSEFEELDMFGNLTGEKLSAGDTLINAGYALKLGKVNTGINVKLLNARLAEQGSTAMAFDIGVLYKMSVPNGGTEKIIDNLGIGLAIQNMGSSLNYGNQDISLPVNFRIGAGYYLFKNEYHGINTGLDINFPNDSGMIMSIGMEYSFNEMIFGRLGYKLTGRDVDYLSVGIGGKYNFAGKSGSFDYSLVPLSDLGTIHAISVGIKFQSEPARTESVEKQEPRKTQEKAAEIDEAEIEPETEATDESKETIEEEKNELEETAEEEANTGSEETPVENENTESEIETD